MTLGVALAEAVLDSPWRIALVASSSWSHAFLCDHTYLLRPDTPADRRSRTHLGGKQRTISGRSNIQAESLQGIESFVAGSGIDPTLAKPIGQRPPRVISKAKRAGSDRERLVERLRVVRERLASDVACGSNAGYGDERQDGGQPKGVSHGRSPVRSPDAPNGCHSYGAVPRSV
jgi:hypothetical protein